MDNLHNKTLIPQAHVVVDFTIEFVDSLDDPNYCGSTFALVFVGCVCIQMFLGCQNLVGKLVIDAFSESYLQPN
jgi:hypothetical protein